MLVTIPLSLLSILATSTIKNSWEVVSRSTMIIGLIVIIKYPLTSSIFTPSKSLMLDSISLLILVLSRWITSLIVIAIYYIKTKKNSNIFLGVSIILLTTLIICFSINNLLLFYIWFETSLIPTIFIIVIWGNQPERKTARLYIILYTITASIPMLITILKLSSTNFHIRLTLMSPYSLPLIINQHIRWVILIIAFIVKLPIFSLHIWLPKAHVEAPVAGSIVLAAILLKLGRYGLIRINKLIYLQQSLITYSIICIATIGAIITNIICLRQTDLKALIAYSSVGHMGLIIIRTLTNSKIGQYSRLVIILTHGLTSSIIFFLTNLMYEKINSRNIILISGLVNTTPITSIIWIMSVSANMALPPRLNLAGEITAIISATFIAKRILILLIVTNISTATYSLYLYSTINHGNQLKITNPSIPIVSINITISMSHLWPLVVFSTVPIKLILWC